ncbi:MAG: bifunctional glutamate N-acetyltransferase/amino-acid acetyltransferase ArgJ [Clostridia bacterium]|nr:bifunctional glutamate N-acetyltransferase/amino-acid acetyltransferase ArgJ [Clostridia bacterium]
MQYIQGGVCAAKGFLAAGVHCGIRHNRTKRDLALILSEVKASAAGIYTKNLVKGAPILVTRAHLEDGCAQAIIANSGNANTCNANGVEIAEGMCALAADHAKIAAEDVIVASTGVIGQTLSLLPIQAGMNDLIADLSRDGSARAVQAIMTTDTVPKECAVEFELEGKICRLGGIAKGSGMIHPNMATMLVFLTTDAAIAPEMLKKALVKDADATFHMISVDGDTSTNDTEVILANGMAGNGMICEEGAQFDTFCQALNMVTTKLCRAMAKDGEGATKLLECAVTGAKTLEDARTAAKSVICSSLTKAAMYGADANWGRVLCALGYSGADIDVDKVNVAFLSAAGRIEVCENGAGIPFSEEEAKKILLEDEINILVDLNDGRESATAWGCDLTYDYVKINGDYRT